jgi:hypothetical protein
VPFTICCGFESSQPVFVNSALTRNSSADWPKVWRKAAQGLDNFHIKNFAADFESFRWEIFEPRETPNRCNGSDAGGYFFPPIPFRYSTRPAA